MDNTFKLQLYQECVAVVNSRIAAIQKAVDAAKEAAKLEERSTAGDKYDTARAMSHIDQGMYTVQLNEVMKLKKSIDQVSIDKKFDKVALGALVHTSNGYYYLVASIGAIKISKILVMVVSPVSPIGQLLLDKTSGEKFVWNNKKIEIIAVT